MEINIKNIKPMTDFRNNIKRYLKELQDNKKPIVLTQHGKSAAVLMDAGHYQDMRDQIEFMHKVAVGLDDYRKKRIAPASEVFRDIDAFLTKEK